MLRVSVTSIAIFTQIGQQMWKLRIALHIYVNYGSHCNNFHETHSLSTALHVHILCKMSQKAVRNM
jgi:hypothetical protein